jgi:hypothetical protein
VKLCAETRGGYAPSEQDRHPGSVEKLPYSMCVTIDGVCIGDTKVCDYFFPELLFCIL